MTRAAFLAAAGTAATLLREPALPDRWTGPSALPGFTTGGLARHLANQVTRTVDHLTGPPGRTAIPLLEHFTGNDWVTTGADSEANRSIRHRSETAAAATTAPELSLLVDAAVAELQVLVPAQPPDRIVDLGDWGLTIDDFLLTRVVELVVHADDLAVSLGIPTPPLPPAAVAATVELLGRIAVWRHGGLAVVRALSRQERSPATISAF